MSDKSTMHGGGESCSGVVPAKQPNKSGKPQAEVVEERPLAALLHHVTVDLLRDSYHRGLRKGR